MESKRQKAADVQVKLTDLEEAVSSSSTAHYRRMILPKIWAMQDLLVDVQLYLEDMESREDDGPQS